MNNPYPYSLDNKRYQTMNYYFKTKYNQKVAKVPLNANFTCPNRDGSKGIGGCTFCSEKGSGDSVLNFNSSLETQYVTGLMRMQKKWPNCLGFAYFQSFSNTYAPLSVLRQIYDSFYLREDVAGVCIATRADCLTDEMIAYFAQKALVKETWIELGLQSIHEDTMKLCNRCHDSQIVFDVVEKLKKTNIKCCVHIMNSLPNESKKDMIETALKVSHSHCDAIKIHMLHIIEGTKMAEEYKLNPFKLLSLEEYVDVVVSQLEILDPNMIIERLTGDGIASDLIAPEWTIKKTIVYNEIDKEMVRRNTWQGKFYK
ncbi:TIGR01212 family radical SAM protein [Floccifex sp.]|uniref:TIGR01212 family radical SAM protein n=1 Tax=Floccifex sp. TaxID=2815810 RepID=UPI002A74E8FE|nr:TIGR01212 family radical SAM protein [Floccifex sp.]MDD7281194.1 TIGR01212 family radical SAM protein [Erysipelotrichaceae bacterium]MDY2958077.1 TIGR01212 family radical SAM protein [Floccifex sp.]